MSSIAVNAISLGCRAGGNSGNVEGSRCEGGRRRRERGAAAEVQLMHEGSHCVLCQVPFCRHTAEKEKEE